MGSPRDCDRKVWRYWAHELFTGRTDSDLHNVGEVVVVPRSIGAHVTRGVVSLLQPHQQGLVFFRLAEDDFLRYNAPRFSGVMFTANDSAEPLDCFSKGSDDQFAALLIGRNGILECRGSGLDAGCPDLEPFSKILDEFIELGMRLERSFEAVEYPSLCLKGSKWRE